MSDKINFNLPMVDVNEIEKKFMLSQYEKDIILGILHGTKNGVGIIKATRPTSSNVLSWVWRSVMMFVSPEEKFHSLSPSLDVYLENEEFVDIDVLNSIVDKIISVIPLDKQHGSSHWKQVFGI